MDTSARKKILFVDDEPNILDGLKRLLHGLQGEWDLTFAGSVDEALQRTAETDFDVIATDITMPGKDGFELLRILRNTGKTKDVPIIILTGLNQKEIRVRALDHGATDLLNKPVDREDLLARLRSSIRMKSYQDEIRAHSATLEKKVRERTWELAESRRDLILRLANVVEYKDKNMGSHGLKVGCYARIIAQSLGLDNLFLERLFLAAPLHDIGLIAIPEKILWKSDILTFDEWGLMREHCLIGHEILSGLIKGVALFHSFGGGKSGKGEQPDRNPILRMASSVALTHHEWWNGKGYPKGLEGEAIPLESRIVTLADAYDSLTSDRPHRKALSENEALTRIRQKIGEQFDPEVYVAFDKSLQKFRSVQQQFSALDSVAGE